MTASLPDGSPLKLLFVMNAPITGGAERHTLDLAADLADQGCRSTIFAIKGGPIRSPAPVRLVQPEAPRRLPARIGDLRRLIAEERPDVLVSVNERPILVAALARMGPLRVPLAAIMHSTVLNNWRERAMQVGYTPIFNRSDRVVFVSSNQRAYWAERRLRPREGSVIPNGVDLARFSPERRAALRAAQRRSCGFADEDLVLGICAVLRPEKNHLQFVDSVARLRRQGVRAKALIIGDGPCRRAIDARIRQLDLAEHVRVTGIVEDVRPFVAASDLGVLCSVSIETLSLAALETMAMGVPMVMSDLGGASEIIDEANGRLFPVRDDAALDRALLALADPVVRRAAGVAARRHVERLFDRRRMVAAYRELFFALRDDRARSDLRGAKPSVS